MKFNSPIDQESTVSNVKQPVYLVTSHSVLLSLHRDCATMNAEMSSFTAGPVRGLAGQSNLRTCLRRPPVPSKKVQTRVSDRAGNT